ncbi:MAG: nucleotide exchange factor GrpE [Clostridiales bacterium]|nr:nucleotide exchange factor GrpE [Clostridiales bacterium]
MDEKKKETTKESEEVQETKVSAAESVENEVEELKKQVEEYKDKWIRNVAEFDNYKKRTASTWSEGFNEGIASVVVKILPVGDNLDWALTLGLDQKTADGIRAVKRKFNDTLSSLEIEEIDPTGEPFDPNVAEAVMQVDGDEGEESGTVKMVLQKGYRRKDKIIRYATVSVVK